MTITLHTATDADLAAINARYADIGFMRSHTGELIVVAKLTGHTAGQGRVVGLAVGENRKLSAVVRSGLSWTKTDVMTYIVDTNSRHANPPRS